MADITNASFRLICRECGSSMSTSEEIAVRALLNGSERSCEAAFFFPEERPVAIQLLGADPNLLSEAAKMAQCLGADIVDLNMGCPVPKVVKKGEGAALMKDPMAAARIFAAMRRAVQIPLTVKIRGGWDEEHLNAVAIARIAESEGVAAITVHPRTRSQRFTGKAPWEIIKEVVESVSIPVTGNGDVKSWADARRMMQETGARSVMIGRGALGRPWIFDPEFEALDAPRQQDYKLRVIKRHYELILSRVSGNRQGIQVKKHLSWYLTGHENAARARHAIFQAANAQAAWEIFLKTWNGVEWENGMVP